MLCTHRHAAQVAAREAMVADQSSVAKEALQQLHGLLVNASAADTFKPGDEAIILTNLMRLVQETAAHSSAGKRRASCVCASCRKTGQWVCDPVQFIYLL